MSNNIVMKINAKRGVKWLDISQPYDKKGESEYLIPRNARPKVVKWDSENRLFEVDYE
ncbi:MAG: hypothetical protein Q8L60_03995 [Gammaproteobacteria bacterium]|nr:hypothetical protein [Gammaproteobacteria bacterium]MDP2347772.1 hypothetical protein [Gammaproteobacteria bacterium]